MITGIRALLKIVVLLVAAPVILVVVVWRAYKEMKKGT